MVAEVLILLCSEEPVLHSEPSRVNDREQLRVVVLVEHDAARINVSDRDVCYVVHGLEDKEERDLVAVVE